MPEHEQFRVEEVNVVHKYRVLYEGDHEISNQLYGYYVDSQTDITHEPDKQWLVADAAKNAADEIDTTIHRHRTATATGRILGAGLIALSTIESSTVETSDKVLLSILGAGILLANEKLRVERVRNDYGNKLKQGKLAAKLRLYGQQQQDLDETLNPGKYSISNKED